MSKCNNLLPSEWDVTRICSSRSYTMSLHDVLLCWYMSVSICISGHVFQEMGYVGTALRVWMLSTQIYDFLAN